MASTVVKLAFAFLVLAPTVADAQFFTFHRSAGPLISIHRSAGANATGSERPGSRAADPTDSHEIRTVQRHANRLRAENHKSLPAPVRSVSHDDYRLQTTDAQSWVESEFVSNEGTFVGEGLGTAPAHQVLRAPAAQRGAAQDAHGFSAPHHANSERGRSTDHPLHRWKQRHPCPPVLTHQQAAQPEPASIPQAIERADWKTPYSYGYFGASSTRHWSKHYGYRDRYKEWRLH